MILVLENTGHSSRPRVNFILVADQKAILRDNAPEAVPRALALESEALFDLVRHNFSKREDVLQ